MLVDCTRTTAVPRPATVSCVARMGMSTHAHMAAASSAVAALMDRALKSERSERFIDKGPYVNNTQRVGVTLSLRGVWLWDCIKSMRV